jgi:hypothetical protein
VKAIRTLKLTRRLSAGVLAAAAVLSLGTAFPAVASAAESAYNTSPRSVNRMWPPELWPDATTTAYICANQIFWDGRSIPGHDRRGVSALYWVVSIVDSPSSTLLEMDSIADDGAQAWGIEIRC